MYAVLYKKQIAVAHSLFQFTADLLHALNLMFRLCVNESHYHWHLQIKYFDNMDMQILSHDILPHHYILHDANAALSRSFSGWMEGS